MVNENILYMPNKKTNERYISINGTIVFFCLAFYIFYIIAPFFPRAISLIFSSYIILPVWVVLLLGLCSSRLNKLIPLLSILFLSFILTLIKGGEFLDLVYKLIYSSLPLCTGLIISRLSEKKKNKLKNILIFAFSITLITSLVFSKTGDIRYDASIANSNDPYLVELSLKNIGGFSFTYMMVVLYPAIQYCIRKKRVLVRLLILLFFLFFFIKAGYTIALLCFVFSNLLLLIMRNNFNKKTIIFILIAIIFVLVLREYISQILILLSNNIENQDMSDRLLFVSEVFNGNFDNSNSIAGAARVDVYSKSLINFINHPILGGAITNSYSGGHSFILDMLGDYGLFGLCILIFSYRAIAKEFLFKDTPRSAYGYVVVSLISCIVLSIFNPGNHWFEMCFAIPLLFTANRKEECL